ncbi:hypothetical protein O6H91_Y349000 [Diphasiastrum complanatum]|nr:hypothetical protein O6H91_Y349000 [Diphasiastrum complanatum]KAJ7283084.1 hypothetical protein O6H91_Y349000 [Diphasiastrum complanatum]KAJ7283085.1 hypothetical protein O6H91_Y349000 [Diphasiastrum complanatum]KAJ7283087.1 hypothetical protein O6H91_Y349000 [Diphasiastrum complanatum]
MDSEYVIVDLQETGVFHYALSVLLNHQISSVKSSPSMQHKVHDSWRAKLSILIMKLMLSISVPLAKIGDILEVFLNTLSANGGLTNVIYKLLTGQGVEIPQKDSDKYWTVIGHLDPRLDLFAHEDNSDTDDLASFLNSNGDFRPQADLCMMASKLAYENRAIMRQVVTDRWHMHYVEAHNCWNENKKEDSTRVLLLTDREQDARALVVAFRGTEPFSARDWNIDFDFSWFDIPRLGRVHAGFLEALGLGDRNDLGTFLKELDKESDSASSACHGQKILAYYLVFWEIEEILNRNPNAKLYLTGHSLGGALAITFAAVLCYQNKTHILERLAAIYSFGQPRVGDKRFAEYMENKLNDPINRNFRIVYGNDIVPRVPFDDQLFQFKHIAPCFYFNSCYEEKTMSEEPHRNYIPVATRVTAIWEFIQSFFLKYFYGESYQESMTSTVFRMAGIFLPGVVAHSPVNYVNSIRLGPKYLNPQVQIVRDINDL